MAKTGWLAAGNCQHEPDIRAPSAAPCVETAALGAPRVYCIPFSVDREWFDAHVEADSYESAHEMTRVAALRYARRLNPLGTIVLTSTAGEDADAELQSAGFST